MNRARWVWACAVLHGSVAWAYGNSQCVPLECVGAGGCRGERACLAGGAHSSSCFCEEYPCQTACGTSGYRSANGACVATEQCNNCDDDLDGLKDEGLDCTGTSLIPTSCDGSQAVPGEWNAAQELETQATNDGVRIAGRQRSRVSVYASSNAAGFKVHYTASVHPSDEISLIDKPNNTSVPLTRNASVVLANYFWYGNATGTTWQFTSDSTLPSSALQFSEFTPICSSGVHPPVVAPLRETGEQSLALLSKQPGSLIGDTVFFSFVATGNKTSIWTDGRGVSGDIDLYVSVGQLPDKTTTLRSVRTGTASEIVRARFDAGKTVFVAVHARTAQDSGLIRVRMATQLEGMSFSQGICTNFKPTAEEDQKIRAMVDFGRRAFWAATEGKAEVSSVNYQIDNNCIGNCTVCIRADPGRAFAWINANYVQLYDEWSYRSAGGAGSVLSHEWSHALLGLPDEYADHGEVEITDTPWTPCHNETLCATSKMSVPVRENLCTDFVHGWIERTNLHICANSGSTPPYRGNDYCLVTTRESCNACTGCNTSPAPTWAPSAWQVGVDNNKFDSKPFFTPELWRYVDFQF